MCIVADIRALLIDLDGVLLHWPPEATRQAELAGGLPDGAIARAAFDPELLRAAITGRVPDEQWRAAALARLEREHPGADARRAVAVWSASAGVPDEAAVLLVRRVRLRAGVVLVTYATSRLGADLGLLGLRDAFDGVVSSFEVGAAKPDPAIFHAALRLAGIPAHAATFVDDSAANVVGAAAVGIAGHLHLGPADLRAHLVCWGLLAAGLGPLSEIFLGYPQRPTETRE